MAATVDLQEFVLGFVVEAEEYLDAVNRNLVSVAAAIKKNQAEPRAVRELFRALHTIKGLASMVGADPIVAISHEMESIMRTAERAGGSLSDSTLDLLVQGTRALEERVRAISEKGIGGIPPASPQLLEALALSQKTSTPKLSTPAAGLQLPDEILKSMSTSEREQVAQTHLSGRRVMLVDFQPSPTRADLGFNITSVRERLGRLGEIIKVLPRSSPKAPTGIVFTLILDTLAENSSLLEATGIESEDLIEVAAPAPEALETSSPLTTDVEFEGEHDWTPSDHSSVRVDIRRLDDALERLAELVVTRSKLARAVASLTAKGIDTRELNIVMAENTRQLKRLRAAITKARMVPLAELLQRLPLVVRGLTKDTDKSVNLILRVGAAEVDKAVADKIFPAIVHLVRNAVDHAIESREERLAAGKPETATLSVVSDDSSGTNLQLTVSDDGRGISREAVARKAGRAVARSEDELLQQITLPGLSTKDDVTHTSGRGMGMDIVRRTIEMLGGALALTTESGVGTRFTMHVPVSITIVDVLSFEVAGQTFAVPLAMVNEIVEIQADQLTKAPIPARGAYGFDQRRQLQPRLLRCRGEAIPLLTLDCVLYRAEDRVPAKALVVRQQNGGLIAFGVDRTLAQQEVVVRPLDDVLVRSKGMAGATDLGDGQPTLVLDLASLAAVVAKMGEADEFALSPLKMNGPSAGKTIQKTTGFS